MTTPLHRSQLQIGVAAAAVGLLIAGCASTSGEAARAASDSRTSVTTAIVTATITATTTETITQTESVTQTVALPFGGGGGSSRKVFDETKVEQGVMTVLTGAPPTGYGLSGVADLTCPPDQPVTGGTSFTCQLTIDGNPQEVTIDVKDDTGLYEVNPPS